MTFAELEGGDFFRVPGEGEVWEKYDVHDKDGVLTHSIAHLTLTQNTPKTIWRPVGFPRETWAVPYEVEVKKVTIQVDGGQKMTFGELEDADFFRVPGQTRVWEKYDVYDRDGNKAKSVAHLALIQKNTWQLGDDHEKWYTPNGIIVEKVTIQVN